MGNQLYIPIIVLLFQTFQDNFPAVFEKLYELKVDAMMFNSEKDTKIGSMCNECNTIFVNLKINLKTKILTNTVIQLFCMVKYSHLNLVMKIHTN